MMYLPRNIGFADESDTTHTKVITASGTVNTKGSWTQMFTALDFDVFLIDILVTSVSADGVDTGALLDIGADPAGGTAYGVRIPDILIGHASGDAEKNVVTTITIPVHIPSGSTVAARSQSKVSADTVDVGLWLYGGVPTADPFPDGGLVVPYGVTVSTSSGTTPPNASANVEGAWQELVAATTHPHRGLSVAVQGADATLGSDDFLIDIGIGAASSEVVIAEHIAAHDTGQEEFWIATHGRAFYQPIPEGSRLAVRAQADVNSAQDDLDVAVYGWG